MTGYLQAGQVHAGLRKVGSWRTIAAASVLLAAGMQCTLPAFADEVGLRPAFVSAGSKKFDGRVPEGVKPENGAEPGAEASDVPDDPEFGPPHRFQIVRNGEDVLRIDRQKGTVGVCNKQNGVWRCAPVPLAEDAYEAEIVSLNGQIDALRQRIAELEAERKKGAEDRDAAPGASSPQTDDGKSSDAERSLGPEDEQELNKVLDFSEQAMRRLFGLMQDLRREMDGEPSSR